MNARSIATLALAALLAASAPVLAQNAPNDTGSGHELGMQEMSTSGQVGTVTLYGRGADSQVVLNVKSTPAGKHEPAHIHRGHDCSSFNPAPSFNLKDVVNGRSSTLIGVPYSRLVSGNYVVVVHASQQAMGHYVSCGQLY